jgi:hypothetical protein
VTKGRRKPRFLYWVTLNTHVPVAPGDALNDFHCERGDSAFGTTTVCRMAELWHDFFRTLSTIALGPSVFPADILVVGDHAPQCGSSAGGPSSRPAKLPDIACRGARKRSWPVIGPKQQACGARAAGAGDQLLKCFDSFRLCA